MRASHLRLVCSDCPVARRRRHNDALLGMATLVVSAAVSVFVIALAAHIGWWLI